MDGGLRLSASQRRFLEGLFPGGEALFSPEETLVYGVDSSRYFAPPLAVVRPQDVEQVRELLAWAHQERMPLFPRASGTNMSGCCVPQGGGVVVSCLGLNSILEIDDEDFLVVTEPGVVTSRLQAEVEAKGMFYAPDPASLKISTIGGNVSTNAGGMRAVKYGVTRDFVLGLEAVLPGGEVIRTGGRTHKNVVGLDLTRLLVGSEGTLAFITRIILKLLPRPEDTASALLGFARLEDALDCARSVFRAGILPTALELLAEEVLDCVAMLKTPPWPDGVRAALLIRLDGSRDTLELETRRLATVAASRHPLFQASGRGKAEEEPLWEIRRMISPAAFRLRPNKISDDIAVPRGRTLEAILGMRAIGREFDLPILNYGHLGDGNIHTNVMFDASVPGQSEAAHQAMRRIIELVLSLGGTISGEHGVGLTKLPYVGMQLSETERGLMRAIKKSFDPHGIMNPGKAF